MSRSKHTDPLPVRASRRAAAPRGKRNDADPSLRRRLGQLVRHMGADWSDRAAPRAAVDVSALPRIIEHRPRRGFHHAAQREDVTQLLAYLGSGATYGIRSIELCQCPATTPRGLPKFGSLCVPGRIRLYELPLSPWRLRGLLA